jgi:hypothetical protein
LQVCREVLFRILCKGRLGQARLGHGKEEQAYE